MAVVFGATLALGAAPAGAALSADQVKRQVETQYGVKVLRVKPMTEQGRSAFALTIMNPGGAFNEPGDPSSSTARAPAVSNRRRRRYRPGPVRARHPRRKRDTGVARVKSAPAALSE
jgi:hypothetical protein